MNAIDTVLQDIANNLDKRRLELTKLRRVLLSHVGKTLEPTVVRIAIPMIYAHWEGYVKEACQLYLEHIEASVKRADNLHPAILGYLWTSVLRPLTGGLGSKRQREVAKAVCQSLAAPVTFARREKEINTKSNLNYAVLQIIADHLCLDISGLAGWRYHLDTLVNLRNNIAHGSRPTGLAYSDFEGYALSTVALMEEFEQVIAKALKTSAFAKP